jgi:hypothetical protein
MENPENPNFVNAKTIASTAQKRLKQTFTAISAADSSNSKISSKPKGFGKDAKQPQYNLILDNADLASLNLPHHEPIKALFNNGFEGKIPQMALPVLAKMAQIDPEQFDSTDVADLQIAILSFLVSWGKKHNIIKDNTSLPAHDPLARLGQYTPEDIQAAAEKLRKGVQSVQSTPEIKNLIENNSQKNLISYQEFEIIQDPNDYFVEILWATNQINLWFNDFLDQIREAVATSFENRKQAWKKIKLSDPLGQQALNAVRDPNYKVDLNQGYGNSNVNKVSNLVVYMATQSYIQKLTPFSKWKDHRNYITTLLQPLINEGFLTEKESQETSVKKLNEWINEQILQNIDFVKGFLTSGRDDTSNTQDVSDRYDRSLALLNTEDWKVDLNNLQQTVVYSPLIFAVGVAFQKYNNQQMASFAQWKTLLGQENLQNSQEAVVISSEIPSFENLLEMHQAGLAAMGSYIRYLGDLDPMPTFEEMRSNVDPSLDENLYNAILRGDALPTALSETFKKADTEGKALLAPFFNEDTQTYNIPHLIRACLLVPENENDALFSLLVMAQLHNTFVASQLFPKDHHLWLDMPETIDASSQIDKLVPVSKNLAEKSAHVLTYEELLTIRQQGLEPIRELVEYWAYEGKEQPAPKGDDFSKSFYDPAPLMRQNAQDVFRESLQGLLFKNFNLNGNFDLALFCQTALVEPNDKLEAFSSNLILFPLIKYAQQLYFIGPEHGENVFHILGETQKSQFIEQFKKDIQWGNQKAFEEEAYLRAPYNDKYPQFEPKAVAFGKFYPTDINAVLDTLVERSKTESQKRQDSLEKTQTLAPEVQAFHARLNKIMDAFGARRRSLDQLTVLTYTLQRYANEKNLTGFDQVVMPDWVTAMNARTLEMPEHQTLNNVMERLIEDAISEGISLREILNRHRPTQEDLSSAQMDYLVNVVAYELRHTKDRRSGPLFNSKGQVTVAFEGSSGITPEIRQEAQAKIPEILKGKNADGSGDITATFLPSNLFETVNTLGVELLGEARLLDATGQSVDDLNQMVRDHFDTLFAVMSTRIHTPHADAMLQKRQEILEGTWEVFSKTSPSSGESQLSLFERVDSKNTLDPLETTVLSALLESAYEEYLSVPAFVTPSTDVELTAEASVPSPKPCKTPEEQEARWRQMALSHRLKTLLIPKQPALRDYRQQDLAPLVEALENRIRSIGDYEDLAFDFAAFNAAYQAKTPVDQRIFEALETLFEPENAQQTQLTCSLLALKPEESRNMLNTMVQDYTGQNNKAGMETHEAEQIAWAFMVRAAKVTNDTDLINTRVYEGMVNLLENPGMTLAEAFDSKTSTVPARQFQTLVVALASRGVNQIVPTQKDHDRVRAHLGKRRIVTLAVEYALNPEILETQLRNPKTIREFLELLESTSKDQIQTTGSVISLPQDEETLGLDLGLSQEGLNLIAQKIQDGSWPAHLSAVALKDSQETIYPSQLHYLVHDILPQLVPVEDIPTTQMVILDHAMRKAKLGIPQDEAIIMGPPTYRDLQHIVNLARKVLSCPDLYINQWLGLGDHLDYFYDAMAKGEDALNTHSEKITAENLKTFLQAHSLPLCAVIGTPALERHDLKTITDTVISYHNGQNPDHSWTLEDATQDTIASHPVYENYQDHASQPYAASTFLPYYLVTKESSAFRQPLDRTYAKGLLEWFSTHTAHSPYAYYAAFGYDRTKHLAPFLGEYPEIKPPLVRTVEQETAIAEEEQLRKQEVLKQKREALPKKEPDVLKTIYNLGISPRTNALLQVWLAMQQATEGPFSTMRKGQLLIEAYRSAPRDLENPDQIVVEVLDPAELRGQKFFDPDNKKVFLEKNSINRKHFDQEKQRWPEGIRQQLNLSHRDLYPTDVLSAMLKYADEQNWPLVCVPCYDKDGFSDTNLYRQEREVLFVPLDPKNNKFQVFILEENKTQIITSYTSVAFVPIENAIIKKGIYDALRTHYNEQYNRALGFVTIIEEGIYNGTLNSSEGAIFISPEQASAISNQHSFDFPSGIIRVPDTTSAQWDPAAAAIITASTNRQRKQKKPVIPSIAEEAAKTGSEQDKLPTIEKVRGALEALREVIIVNNPNLKQKIDRVLKAYILHEDGTLNITRIEDESGRAKNAFVLREIKKAINGASVKIEALLAFGADHYGKPIMLFSESTPSPTVNGGGPDNATCSQEERDVSVPSYTIRNHTYCL